MLCYSILHLICFKCTILQHHFVYHKCEHSAEHFNYISKTLQVIVKIFKDELTVSPTKVGQKALKKVC